MEGCNSSIAREVYKPQIARYEPVPSPAPSESCDFERIYARQEVLPAHFEMLAVAHLDVNIRGKSAESSQGD